jgi:ribulose 1,5-bisphosphate carboxylase large subunit-like protein
MKTKELKMSTLNGGFASSRGDQYTPEDKALIDEFIRTKGVQVIQPAAASSNEASRGTRERVAQARREFRKAQKTKNK